MQKLEPNGVSSATSDAVSYNAVDEHMLIEFALLEHAQQNIEELYGLGIVGFISNVQDSDELTSKEGAQLTPNASPSFADDVLRPWHADELSFAADNCSIRETSPAA